jgi:hypothetical protein
MSNTRDVKRYLDEGFSIIPIPRGEKGPRISNWQNTTFDESHFSETDNIGVRLGDPSRGLTDIDLDCNEALEAAPALLLSTQRVHGRRSKPQSHYWYIAPGSKSEAFKDIDGKVFCEIRSTGGQTVLPPSVHPSGEVLEWDIDRETPTVDTQGLRHSVVLLATACMIGRYWPNQGSRHEAAGLAAGMLASLKLSPMEVEHVIIQATKIARDPDVEDRARYARDTCSKFTSGGPTSGGPKFADMLGDKGAEIVKRIRSWYGVNKAGGSLIEDLNEKHAFIFQQSGDAVIITEDRDMDGKHFLRFSSPETFRSLYPQQVNVGQNQRGQPILKPLGKIWLESKHRRFYNGIELAPNGRSTPGYYNMWRGFAVEPKKGSWSRFRAHIEEIICCENQGLIDYVLSWMANTVQRPGYPAQTAIALRGGQGTGKGAFVRGFGALFGVHFVHLDSTRHLTGNFNAHLHNAILVFADEAAWPGDKAGLGALKRLVTEPTLSIERKGMDIMSVPNMIHLLLASNEDWIVPAGSDERRFAVLDVSKKKQQDSTHFAAIEDELMKNGGLQAMLHDLLDFKMKVDLRIIPKTDALLDQKRITSAPQLRWWFQILSDGDFWRREVPGRPGEFLIPREQLYDNYVGTLDRAGQRMKSIQTELGKFLKTVLPAAYPGEYRHRQQNGSWGEREYIVPSLEICRRLYDNKYGLNEEEGIWPAEYQDLSASEEQPRF